MLEFAVRAVAEFLAAADRGELSLEQTVQAWRIEQALVDLRDLGLAGF